VVSEQVVKLTSWVGMAPKKNRKQAFKTRPEEPVEDLVAPSESIGEGNQTPRRTKMSPRLDLKVRRNNGARSYSPWSNLKSSSK